MAHRLIIVGLRRSGTTIFWRTFRQDRRLVCYDEPFNPWIEVLPRRNVLKHDREFMALLEQNSRRFWEIYTPIHHTQELKPGLSDEHRRYLEFLGGTGDRVCVDTTRCQFKIAALKEVAPDAVLVHLYRPAPSHATSHMLPSGSGIRAKLGKIRYRRDFWTRPDKFGFWSIEEIVGQPEHSLFAHRLRDAGLDPEAVYRLPAVGKLLAYWRVNFERAERDGREHFGERFVSQDFDAFCADPRGQLEVIYGHLGLPMPELDYSGIHPANRPYDEQSPNWEKYLKSVGIEGRSSSTVGTVDGGW